MKTRISVRVIDGEFTMAETTVEGDTLLDAIARVARVFSPHLEAGRQLQVTEAIGWCDTCDSFHLNIERTIAAFDDAMQRGGEILKQMQSSGIDFPGVTGHTKKPDVN